MICPQIRNNKKTAVLAVCGESEADQKGDGKKDGKKSSFILYRPNTGLQMKQEPYSDLKKKYKKVRHHHQLFRNVRENSPLYITVFIS